MLRQTLLFAHLAGVVIWVGGMFFAYFCLRPAAAKLLDPPQRLPLWLASFETFFRYAAIAVATIVISGIAMFAQVGFRQSPLGWHIMLALGLTMAFIFGHVYAVLYRRLRVQCAATDWPAAGATLNSIRRMVATNLLLALLTVAAAAFSR